VRTTGAVRDSRTFEGGTFVSIIRVGLSETKNYSDGYDAIFGKKKGTAKKPAAKASSAKKSKKGKKK